MARQVLTKTLNSGKAPAAGIAVTFTAADATNFEQFPLTGNELILVWNTHASTGYTFTISSTADALGRTQDITTQAIAAGAMYVIGPLNNNFGWIQTDGSLHLQASNSSVKWAILNVS